MLFLIILDLLRHRFVAVTRRPLYYAAKIIPLTLIF